MTIKPTGTKVLVKHLPKRQATAGGIVLLEKYDDDEKRVRVLACGPKVAAEIQPGLNALLVMAGADRHPLEDGSGRFFIEAQEIIALWPSE